MKKNKLFGTIIAILGMLVFTACSNEDYMTFDSTNTGVYFLGDTLQRYSFGVTPMEQTTYTMMVPFRVLGGTSDADRTVTVEVIADSTTAQEGVQYVLGEAKLLADSINGYVPVTILRDGLEGTYATGYQKYKLGLRLKENENFKPTLETRNQLRVLVFDNAVEMPAWLNAKGEKIWPEYSLGKWHPYKLIKMVEFFHGLEETMPESYVRMVALYGPNLESIQYADPYQFKIIFQKYIYEPMYLFFNDPANRDMILNAYPDFPFDMPNPYY